MSRPIDWTARDDEDAWAEWCRDHEDVDAEAWAWAEGVMARAQQALDRVAEFGWEWWPGDTGEQGTARALASQGPADNDEGGAA